MAINKRARNMITDIKKEHIIIAGKFEEQSEQISMHSAKEDLTLVSNKKIIAHGNQ